MKVESVVCTCVKYVTYFVCYYFGVILLILSDCFCYLLSIGIFVEKYIHMSAIYLGFCGFCVFFATFFSEVSPYGKGCTSVEYVDTLEMS